MKSKPIGTLLVIVTLVVGIAAFAPSASAQSTASVTVAKGAGSQGCETDNSCFQPYEVKVDVGGTVTWTNTDSQTHTVTSGVPSDNETGTVFDSGISKFKAGTTFSHTFTDAGKFDYFCQLHPWMAGIVDVEAAGEQPPPAVPEFGPIASLVLVIAIISVVAVTAKTRGFLKL